MTSKRLGEIRERYCVPHYLEMLVPEAHERACYPRLGCVAVSEYLFRAGVQGVVLLDSLGAHGPFVVGLPSSIKGWKESWCEGRVERLSKDSTSRASEEEALQSQEKAKEPRGKEKVSEEPKKRKLVHISSSSGKFGSSVSQGKEARPPKLLEAASKAVRIEMVRHVEADVVREEVARRQAEVAEEKAAKQKPVRVQGKSLSFLASREEPMAPALFHASTCDATDLTRALVSHSVRTFGLTLECREAITDFETRTQSSEKKATSLVEELKAARAEAEEVRAQKLEESAKLESALAQIEVLKREVHESQCVVASLTKKVERAKELYPNQDLSQLKSEFVDEVPQTPADEVVGDEVTEVEEAHSDAQAVKVPAAEAPPPSSQA
ncbi:axoneme-associated protein mst101(2)-like [Olea europaea var. sylvestris]|uniref:axoneme-associated protein mst101(2)-like n=1 Tax=Olea europaea var. sylvestris TaxID=158386 RepID=UPI000C1CF600|nr:axoneme-associated protein mst101(2)-like [Olea europaea var. sylvestris]